MELFTSLVQLKQAMNGGQLPPMTPVPKSSRRIIDPSLTIGMGALYEDAALGLRCPVRGCGRWKHQLTAHLNAVHPEIGGAREFKRLLGLPVGVSLISSTYRAARKSIAAARRDDLAQHLARVRQPEKLNAARAQANRSQRQTKRSMHHRNLRNQCEAQMRNRIVGLEVRLGRSASIAEARSEIGEGFVKAVLNAYGSWNAARAQFGLAINQIKSKSDPRSKEIYREGVLASLRAWHETHGSLPTSADAQRADRAPLIPTTATVCRALGTDSWPEAMRRAASLLNIYGGRYGLPIEHKPAA